MKRTMALGMACCLLLIGGCKSSGYKEGEEIFEEVLKCGDDLNDIYLGVKDPVTAKAAAAKIDQICDRLEKLADRLSKVKVRESEDTELEAKYAPKLDAQAEMLQTSRNQAEENAKGEKAYMAANLRLDMLSLRGVR